MMIAVIIPFYLGYGIFALIALPILLSGMFGMCFSKPKKVDLKEKEQSISAVAE